MPLCTALIIAAAAYAAKANNEGTEDDSISPEDIDASFLEGKTPIELLPLEQKLTIFENPISTISFYECSSLIPADFKSLVGRLENRVKDILRVNPWLGGWLVSGKGVGSFDKTYRVWYDPNGEDSAPTIFQELTYKDVPVGRSTPFFEYETLLIKSTALVKNNPLAINRKNEPLFRVTIIPEQENVDDVDSPTIGFALLVSMSHVCGDAHTYYRIYNMLLGKAHVTALIPKRELGFSEKAMDLMGRNESLYVSNITTDPAWAKLFRVSSSLDDDPESELKGRVFIVDEHWIGNIKAESMVQGNISDLAKSVKRSPMSNAITYQLASVQNPTQSTNDILVSWFWNILKPDVGLMAVNLRDRVDIVSNNHVGNYNNPLSYTPDDYKTPQLIRESMKKCKRAGVVEETGASSVLPRANPDITCSIVTNWSSFLPLAVNQLSEEDVDEGVEWNNDSVGLIRHLPLIYPQQMIKALPKRLSFMVIFSCGEDVGCLILAPRRVLPEIDSCGICKDVIAEF